MVGAYTSQTELGIHTMIQNRANCGSQYNRGYMLTELGTLYYKNIRTMEFSIKEDMCRQNWGHYYYNRGYKYADRIGHIILQN